MIYKRQKFENGKVLDAEHLNDIAKGLDGYEASCDQELTQIWAELNELRGLRDEVQSWPVMKNGANWLKGSGTFDYAGYRVGIEEIHFVTSVSTEQTTSADATWNVDEGDTGSIKGYRHGNTITISTEGAEKIRFNANAVGYFSKTTGLTALTGLELIDASLATNCAALFNETGLEYIDISFWHLEKNIKLNGAFYMSPNLKKVKLPRYGQPLITTTESAFEGCANLIEVDMGRGIPLLSLKTFKKCINLEGITGLGSVTTIGDEAFLYTPKLTYVDLNPEIITSIGTSACRLSSIEDSVDLSAVPTVGDMATRTARWGDALKDVQNVTMPNVLLDVPKADSQLKYPNVLFGTGNVPWDDTEEPVEVYIAEGGCSVFTLYHEWQCVYAGTDKEKADFLDFWRMFEAKGYPKENPATATNLMGVLTNWSGNTVKVTSAEQLKTVIDRLYDGLPTFIGVHSANVVGGYHCVLVIGADSNTGKLAVLDSKVTEKQAELVWLKFEDIFTATTDNDYIWPHTYS